MHGVRGTGSFEVVQFRILGSVSIRGPRGVVDVTGHTAKTLATLVVNADRVVSAERLIEVLWPGNPPARARNAVQVHIGRLRRSIESVGATGSIETAAAGYRLELHDAQSDLQVLESTAKAVARDGISSHVDRARMVLAADEYDADLFDSPVLEAVLVRAIEDRRTLGDELAEHDLHAGLLTEGSAREMISDAPLRERRWGTLMRLLYREGRQSEALRAFAECARLLRDELGVQPGPDLAALEESILLHDVVDPSRSAESRPLPYEQTPFVGRREDIDAVTKALESDRLITILGLGGIGKTRLALEIARRQQSLGRPAVFSSLAGCGSVTEVVAEIAAAGGLGVRDDFTVQTLVAGLREHRGLLILDRCEHLLDVLPGLLSAVLAGAGHVSVVATSRVPFNMSTERRFPLGPLNLPDIGDQFAPADAEDLLRQALERTIGNATQRLERSDVVSLCAAAEGIPLALELTAGLAGAIPLAELAEMVRTDHTLLVGQEGSMVGSVQWAADHASEASRRALTALASSHGGCDLGALVSICAEVIDQPISELLRELTDRALVFLDDSGVRYDLLDTVREFALDTTDGEVLHQIRDAHAAHYRQVVLTESAAFDGPHAASAYRRLEQEDGNISAMLRYEIAASNERVLDLLPALSLFWFRRGRAISGYERAQHLLMSFEEALPRRPDALLYASHLAMWSSDTTRAELYLDQVLEAISGQPHHPLMGMEALARGNLIGWGRGNPADSIEHFERCYKIGGEALDPRALVGLLSGAFMAARAGRTAEAAERIPHVLAFASATMPQFGDMGVALVNGMIDLYEGRAGAGAAQLDECRRLAEELGLISILGPMFVPYAWALLLDGLVDEASEVARDALDRVRELNGGWRIGEVFCVLGGIAQVKGRIDAAREWYARALTASIKVPELDIIAWSALGTGATCDDEELTVTAASFAADHEIAVPPQLRAIWSLPHPTKGDDEVTPEQLYGLARSALGKVIR